MKSRTLIILALALLLALSAATASARAVRTPFTGTSTVIGWPTNPDQRYWQPGPNAFWRDMWPIVQLDTTEPRISGTGCLIHDGNYRPAPGDASRICRARSTALYASSKTAIWTARMPPTDGKAALPGSATPMGWRRSRSN